MKYFDDKLKILLENQEIVKFEEDGHKYEVHGIKTPSVTTLLKDAGLSPNYDFVDSEVLEKARMRGESIHYQIEDALKNEDFYELTKEGEFILDYIVYKLNKGKRGGFKDIITEGKIYSHNTLKPFCGRFDILIKDNESGEYYLMDIKTNKSWTGANENYTRWQLSLYAYALNEYGININHFVILKFKYTNEKEVLSLDPIEVKPIDNCKIESLLRGEQVDKELITLSKNEIDIFKEIKAREEELKNLQSQVDTIKKALYKYMLDNDILKAENEDGTIKITRTKESKIVGLDKSRLEKEEPQIFERYKTETKRDGYVKITIKE